MNYFTNLGGIGLSLRRKDELFAYFTLSLPEMQKALVTGIKCHFETLRLTDQHFGLQMESQLDELHDEYLKWITRVGSPIA